MGGEKHEGQPPWLMMKVISRLNQVHVNSSYSTDDGHFPELLLR